MMMHYILQILAFQLIFLLVYELFLKNETFFSYNRAYLLLTPVISLLLPMLKLEFLQQAIPMDSMVALPEVLIGANGNLEMEGSSGAEVTATAAGREVNWWFALYWSGFLLSLVLFLNKFRILKRMFSYRPASNSPEMKIVQVPHSKIACTFYKTIFLGEDLTQDEREQILSHEMVHVRQRHTLDLLYFEMLKIALWFNPLIYIFQSQISAVHEYLADRGGVKNGERKQYYQQLLNTAFNTQNITFINQFFNQSIIKKRIVMLQKSRSKSIAKSKFLILIPLVFAMLTYVSCSQDSAVPKEEQEATAQEKLNEIKAIVEDGTEVTAEDMTEIENILGTISQTDIEESFQGAEKDRVQKLKNSTSKSGDIPFAVIEEVPVFPGCEDLNSNEARKDCMSQKVTEFINKNFDTSLGKELGLKGVNRVYVQFKIAEDGDIKVLGARASHPALEEEARRVVNLLPEMTPGKQQGQEVGVLYSLPIIFQVGE